MSFFFYFLISNLNKLVSSVIIILGVQPLLTLFTPAVIPPAILLTFTFVAVFFGDLVLRILINKRARTFTEMNIAHEHTQVRRHTQSGPNPFEIDFMVLGISIFIYFFSQILIYSQTVQGRMVNGYYAYAVTFAIFFFQAMLDLIFYLSYINQEVRFKLGRQGTDFLFSLGIGFFLVLVGGALMVMLYQGLSLLGLITKPVKFIF